MKNGIYVSALCALVVFSGAAFAATEVFEVIGFGVNPSQARADARGQARATCSAMGGVVTVEELQIVPSGGGYLYYGMAECHL